MSLRFAVRALLSLAAVSGLVLACQGQGEGAPCSTYNNGSADCQGGLSCVPVPGVVGMRCCPTTGTSSSPDCTGMQGSVDANAPPPQGDSGASDATSLEGGPEGGPEASPALDAEAGASSGDTGTDAPAD